MFLNRLKICCPPPLLLFCLVFPFPSLALDEDRLWLPVSHEKLYLALKKAAENAENLDRCESVLRGTVDFDQGTEDKPIFRILCRQSNGKTYNEMVDGLTGTPLTTIIEGDPDLLNGDQQGNKEPELTEEELRLIREQKISEALEAKQKELFDTCMTKSQEKIQLFSSVTMIKREKTLISYTHKDVSDDFVVSGAKAVYRRDFDAKDIEERHLSYRLVCVISGGENDSPFNISIRVKKRRD